MQGLSSLADGNAKSCQPSLSVDRFTYCLWWFSSQPWVVSATHIQTLRQPLRWTSLQIRVAYSPMFLPPPLVICPAHSSYSSLQSSSLLLSESVGLCCVSSPCLVAWKLPRSRKMCRHIAYFIWFPSLRDHTVLPVIWCLKTVVSYILSNFYMFTMRSSLYFLHFWKWLWFSKVSLEETFGTCIFRNVHSRGAWMA